MPVMSKIHQLVQMARCNSLIPNVLKIIYHAHAFKQKYFKTFILFITVAAATNSEYQLRQAMWQLFF